MLKKIRNIALGVGVGLFIIGLYGCVTNSLEVQAVKKSPIKYQEVLNNNSNKFSSIIRLVGGQGNFYCTGFVIDGNYAVTAAHCIDTTTFGFIANENIYIYDQNDNATGIVAVPAAIDKIRDVAFIEGNFKDFRSVPADFEGKYVHTGMIMTSCGFPSGQLDLYCTNLMLVGNMFFRYRTVGAPIYKGMSGGPVFDANGIAIGVNSAVDNSNIIIAPLIGALENVGLK